MNISKINTGFSTPNFLGIKNNRLNKQEDTSDNRKIPVLVNISSDKLNNALKAAVLIPAASLPLIMGSCSKDTECEYWADGGGTSIVYPSIYIMPELKIDSLTFANDSVRIPKELSPSGKVNRTIRNFTDSLKIPNYIEGDYPVRFAYQTPEHINYMTLDGLSSRDDKYIYDVQQFDSNGGVNIFKSEITADDDILKMRNIGTSGVSEYEFELMGDAVIAYKNKDGDFEKYATYKPNLKGNYYINEIKENGDTTKISNVNLLYVNANYENK